MKYLNITRALIHLATAALAVLCLSVAFTSKAHADTIGLHTFSHHTRDSYDWCHSNTSGKRTCPKAYNNRNLGAYYIHESGATAGFYENSYSRYTVYAGYTAYTPFFYGVRGVATLAVATGYKRLYNAGTLRVVLAPGLAYTYRDVTARWTVVPGREGFQHLSLEYKL
jgi:hypothetical protein